MFKKKLWIFAIAVASCLGLWRLGKSGALFAPTLIAATIEPPDKGESSSAQETPKEGKDSAEHEKNSAEHEKDSADHEKEAEEEKHEGGEEEGPQRVSHDAEGRTIVTLDAETQTRIGLKIEPAAKGAYSIGKRAYGRLIEDPAASFTIRAPMAGFLRSSTDTTWPALGSTVVEGASIGAIEPRFTAAERFDFVTRAMDARAEVEELSASLRATRASLESKQRLNSGDRVVSARTIEEAEAMVKGEEARLAAAVKKAEICEAQADSKGSSVGAVPLIMTGGGEVVELLAHPGEASESGQALLRVSNLHRLLARVELPVGETFVEKIQSARLSQPGASGAPLEARVVGPAPAVHPDLGGQSVLLAIDAEKTMWRPGMAVVADLVLEGEPVTGVRIPPQAVLQYGGVTWVYVQKSETEFVRRRVLETHPIAGGLFVTDVTADERVVVSGCGAILSEELKSLAAEEEE